MLRILLPSIIVVWLVVMMIRIGRILRNWLIIASLPTTTSPSSGGRVGGVSSALK